MEDSIDDILIRVDLNWDGYIDFVEYTRTVTPERIKEYHAQYKATVEAKLN